ncbi:hypothetical protein BD560DRAFT_408377 [Blakeslea trispora]|nr:hypothetical protein BD560DRAFT_408377 [Blakeslea trispora]
MYLSRFILAAFCLASESTSVKMCDLQFNMFYWKFSNLQKHVYDLREEHRRLNKSESEQVQSLVKELESQMVTTQSKCCFNHDSPDDRFDPDQLVIFKGFTRSMTNTSQEIADDFQNEIPLYNDKLNKAVITGRARAQGQLD